MREVTITSQEEARNYLEEHKNNGYFDEYIKELDVQGSRIHLDIGVEEVLNDYLQFLMILWISLNEKTRFERFLEWSLGIKGAVFPTWYGKFFWTKHSADKNTYAMFCVEFFGQQVDFVDVKKNPLMQVEGLEKSVEINNRKCTLEPFSANYQSTFRHV